MKISFYLFIGTLMMFLSCHPQETTGDQTIRKEKLRIKTGTLSENRQKPNYSIELNYPKVNNDAWDHLQKYAMNFFMEEQSEFIEHISDLRKSKKKSFSGDYRILYQDDNLLSMLLETTWIIDGASKAMHHSHTVNWDLKRGIPIFESDYFIKKNSASTILALAKKKIPENCDININNLDFTFGKEGIHLKKIYASSNSECYGVEPVLKWKEIEELLTKNGKKFLVKRG